MLVDDQRVGQPEQVGGNGARRRQREHHPDPGRRGQTSGVRAHVRVDLPLQQQHPGPAERVDRVVDLVGPDQGVGPGGDHDAVLTVGGEQDQRHPRRRGRRVQVALVHPGRGEGLADQPAVCVVADAAEDRRPRAEPGRGDGLVGALPAGVDGEVTAEDGLATAGASAVR